MTNEVILQLPENIKSSLAQVVEYMLKNNTIYLTNINVDSSKYKGLLNINLSEHIGTRH